MRRTGAVVLCAVVALGCSGLLGPSEPTLTHELDGAGAEAALALATTLEGNRFPEGVTAACADHARALPWLAAHADDPLVRVAALEATARCASAVERADALTLALHALADEDPARMAAGFRLAAELMADEAETSPLVARVAALADDPRPTVRYAVVEALDRRAWSQEPALAAPFLHALRADEPWLVTEALRRLRYRAVGLVEPDPFVTTCKVLVGDEDPGIRGRAALALARLAPADPDVRSLVRSQLDDPNAYAVSAAAEALGELGWLPAVHELVPLLEDRRPNVWEMVPFEHLDGTPEVPRHSGSVYERTDDAVLRALVRLTEPMGEERFVYREINPRYLALDVIAATRDARRWYEARKDTIPRE